MKAKSPFAARAQAQRKILGLRSSDVAERMRDLGFTSWTEHTVVGVENDRRDLRAGELNAYAAVLGTDRDYLWPPDDYGFGELRGYLVPAAA